MDPEDDMKQVLAKWARFIPEEKEIVEFSARISKLLRSNNLGSPDSSTFRLDILHDYLNFISSSALPDISISAIFNNLSLEYLFVSFIDKDQFRNFIFKILTFISTHSLKSFFSYEYFGILYRYAVYKNVSFNYPTLETNWNKKFFSINCI